MSDEFYLPEADRMQGQSTDNKQMSSGQLDWDVANDIDTNLRDVYAHAYHGYTTCLEKGLSRELARIQLPLANYTELYWKIDLKNFLHYVKLRIDSSHAQHEIVLLAQIMYGMVRKVVPIACQAFEDYELNSITFSGPELMLLASMITDENRSKNDTLSTREKNEFNEKLKRMRELYGK